MKGTMFTRTHKSSTILCQHSADVLQVVKLNWIRKWEALYYIRDVTKLEEGNIGVFSCKYKFLSSQGHTSMQSASSTLSADKLAY